VCVTAFALVILFAAEDAQATDATPSAALASAPAATPSAAAPSRAATDASAIARTPERSEGAGMHDGSTLDPRRYELAGFPIVGGNSDIGLQFGGAVTWTRFFDTARPYLWNIDLLLSASVKNDTAGTRLVQQSHVLRLDAPDLFDDRARLDARGSFLRTINAGYYGIGNATTAEPPPGQPSIGRRYQYLQEEGRVRTIVRVHTGPAKSHTPLDFVVGTNVRYETPTAYDGTKLAEDLAGPPVQATGVLGAPPMLLAGLAAGIMIDTRDSEFVTTRGVFYQLGIGGTAGTAEDVVYGEASAVLAHYAPLGGPFIFASRVVASFEFGRVPFYDLAQGGVFEPQYLLGGETGVRGVPMGRYAGKVKVIANTEVRALPFPRFTVLKQRIRIGLSAFLDAGRVWSDYSVIGATDGTSLGAKWGAGLGAFLQWGEAAIFRVEVAYSPDAVSENPDFPVGVYVSDGVMF
jgi:hypothetical protein